MAEVSPPAATLGLQTQRTGMAWTRSLFLTLITCLLCFRLGLSQPSRLVLFCSLLLAVLAIVMATVGIRRFRLNSPQQITSPPCARSAIAFTAATLVFTALTLAFILLQNIIG